ncbi:MAG TPA: L-dopachrome tautomerase-related protein [Bacteroidales bacterium]|nr:L-dopachrome tautomerase-related protein [Bacteroidales bacterium]
MKNLLFLLGIFLIAGCSDSDDDSKLPSDSLELVFADSVYQLTGVAVSKSGRVFTNYPLWSSVYKYALVEVLPDKTVQPYPNAYMNSWNSNESGMDKWVCVQAVHIDDADNMWVVDPAAPNMTVVVGNSHKLVQINLATNTVVKTYSFAGIADNQSYINDVRVDTMRKFAYLTNSKEGGLVVVNLASGSMRQVLQGHPSVISDPDYTLHIDGKDVKRNGAPVKINSDGLALTPNGEYLYYKPLSDDKLYRIKTEFLRNDNMSSEQLGEMVEDLGHFTTTDGMIFDKKGNLYLGDLEKYRIMRIKPNNNMEVLVQDSSLIWPDSYQVSDDGYLYISNSQIHRTPDFNEGVNRRTSPYTILRIKLPE